MRLVEVMIPTGKRRAVLSTLDEEGIDYALTDEASGREYEGIITFPLPTNAVEPVLDRLRDDGLDRDAYTVVVDAETVVSERFERLEEQYAEEEEDTDRIAREEIHTEAIELVPEFETFVIMTVVSAVVATAGVLVDSPAVVVGSMVIAPLVGPAMATSVGTVVDDSELFRSGLKQQVIGVVLATVSAAGFAILVRNIGLVPPTLDPTSLSQFSGRLTPDFLSLAVALGAGVAGAISLASGISVAIVGVMIAAALIPPIAVVGIGIAWGMPMTVVSSGVLVVVNLTSINLAALVVFWYKEYRPENWFSRDAARSSMTKRVAALILVIGLLSVFLAGVTYSSYENARYQQDVRSQVDSVVGHGSYAHLEVIDVTIEHASEAPFQRPQRVVVTVGRPTGVESPKLADRLRQRLTRRTRPPFGLKPQHPPIDVEVRYVAIDTAGNGAGAPSLARSHSDRNAASAVGTGVIPTSPIAPGVDAAALS